MRCRHHRLQTLQTSYARLQLLPIAHSSLSWLALSLSIWILAVIHPGSSWAADREAAFERWRTHDQSSAMRVDHRNWEAFLLNYLRPGEDGVHRVAYGGVKIRDRRRLHKYIEKMSEVDITAYRRSEQLAYWINLYNALTVKIVLDHYPFATIKKLGIPDDQRTANAWNSQQVTIDGVTLSLDDIEQGILEPIWSDPRIYYAITCPAIGCPNLQPIPFSGDRLERQLNDAAITFVNDARCIRIRGGELHVSSFYRWRLEAFGGTERSVINHLMGYAEPELALALQVFDRMHGDLFDWRLNDFAE